jgi:hypothetical protein
MAVLTHSMLLCCLNCSLDLLIFIRVLTLALMSNKSTVMSIRRHSEQLRPQQPGMERAARFEQRVRISDVE